MQTLGSKFLAFAREANEAHAEAQVCFKRGVAHAERAGKALIKIKAEVGHGEWARWLAHNFDGSDRTAQLYMRIAGRMPLLDEETRIAVADLSLSEAAEALSQRKIVFVRAREEIAHPVRITVTVTEPEPVSVGGIVHRPPERAVLSERSASPARHSAETNVVAYGAPSGASAMIPHLAALVDHSRTLEPAKFANALASSKHVTAHELDRFVEWLTTSARELDLIAGGKSGIGAETPADG